MVQFNLVFIKTGRKRCQCSRSFLWKYWPFFHISWQIRA